MNRLAAIVGSVALLLALPACNEGRENPDSSEATALDAGSPPDAGAPSTTEPPSGPVDGDGEGSGGVTDPPPRPDDPDPDTTLDGLCDLRCRTGGDRGRWSDAVATDAQELVSCALNVGDERPASVSLDVVSAPPGSTQTFVLDGDGTSLELELLLDVVGVFEVEAQCEGPGDVQASDIVPIEALVGSDELYIEMTWDTPADDDQTDTGFNGSDMDLHLLHPDGCWNERPWDCYFDNRDPDWGIPFSDADNPTLAIDDTDGAGPEVIRLGRPSDATTYRVAVNYYNDRRLGPSTPMVRIFLFGRLQGEFIGPEMTERGQWWDVATIAWPSGAVTETGGLTDDPPECEPTVP